MRVTGQILSQHFGGFAVLCVLCTTMFPAHADSLPDPTRPPENLLVRGTGTGIAREGARNSSVGLHSIIISAKRRAAIIDGKTVEIGQMHGNARLIEVNQGNVVLLRGRHRQVLTLFPGVKITHMELADTGSSKMESSKIKVQTDQPALAGKSDQVEHELNPAAQNEKLLSGHPKEEK